MKTKVLISFVLFSHMQKAGFLVTRLKCILSILRSSTGVVNLYETETCLSSFEPKPLRAIMNLTTSCTATKFNSSSEILAIASDQADKAVKLVGTS